MELTYEKNGDYLIPNLTPQSEPEEALTKYGIMRKNYLKEHRRGIYSGLLMTGGLKAHCLEIQKQAEERMELLTGQMAKAEGVDETLKAADQMKWVAKMNSIRHSAEETVLTELVYSL
ncbi:MAG: TnpV protein [Lachnospiraceae bacterium]|nr:TnpV protein [Lachnospiraceae bacterium]